MCFRGNSKLWNLANAYMNLNGVNSVKDAVSMGWRFFSVLGGIYMKFRGHNVGVKYTLSTGLFPARQPCLWGIQKQNFALKLRREEMGGEITLVKGRGVKFRFSIARDVAYWNCEMGGWILFSKPVNLMRMGCGRNYENDLHFLLLILTKVFQALGKKIL